MHGKAAISFSVVGFLAVGFAVSWKLASGSPPTDAVNHPVGESEVIYLGSNGVAFQQRTNDCGLAALVMVLDHHGIKTSVGELARKVQWQRKGTSMATVKELGQLCGLELCGWKLGFKDLSGTPFPLIFLVEDNHFIVVDSVDRRGNLFVRDPSVGRLRIPSNKMADRWRGQALVWCGEGRRSD
ncbi:MAG: cysteine peptidase family C39 domain-containing protein [Ignavibacteriales bacterium]|nr:cysteine peptidase family C39 domain-containing protein [Ignavibacteriales bacterium]